MPLLYRLSSRFSQILVRRRHCLHHFRGLHLHFSKSKSTGFDYHEIVAKTKTDRICRDQIILRRGSVSVHVPEALRW